ncbi:MAG TPA: SMP-30/gluconolactonase/LRE family protein [Pirellulaceae bacterium]|nr:SMP-30/gluconolactonase/LRE family protein [Pirellulaceae bacterium]
MLRRRYLCLLSCALLTSQLLAVETNELPPSHTVKPELYATGFEFAEGPALDHTGNLYVVNYRGNGNIGRIGVDGTASIFCVLEKVAPFEGRKPQANGLKLDKLGRLIVADAGAGRVLRIALDGSTAEVLAERCNGERFKSINDVALDLAGNIYFSDPGGSSAEMPTGTIYRFDINTKKVSMLAKDLAFPNGLAVTPDQRHLIVAESQRYRLLTFALSPEGVASNQRVLCEFPTEDREGIRGGKYDPDGLIMDKAGRCYVGMWSGGVINVVDSATGTLLRQYDAGGAKATNCHFHGPYLYVTVAAKEAVFRLKLGAEGFEYAR